MFVSIEKLTRFIQEILAEIFEIRKDFIFIIRKSSPHRFELITETALQNITGITTVVISAIAKISSETSVDYDAIWNSIEELCGEIIDQYKKNRENIDS